MQPLGFPPDGGEELEEAAGCVRVARAGGLVELSAEDCEELLARGLERLCGGKMAIWGGLDRSEWGVRAREERTYDGGLCEWAGDDVEREGHCPRAVAGSGFPVLLVD